MAGTLREMTPAEAGHPHFDRIPTEVATTTPPSIPSHVVKTSVKSYTTRAFRDLRFVMPVAVRAVATVILVTVAVAEKGRQNNPTAARTAGARPISNLKRWTHGSCRLPAAEVVPDAYLQQARSTRYPDDRLLFEPEQPPLPDRQVRTGAGAYWLSAWWR
ncbi:MAG: hypothetical protein ACLQUY_09280 [Ktedonobacterales bacterium]